MKKIFIVAGDPSGDIHGGNLAKHIQEISPETSIYSAGGIHLKKYSRQITDLTEIAVTGIFEVAGYLKKILDKFNLTAGKIQEIKPDIVILIDFPDFNLRLAGRLKAKGFRIFYYISPQVWAWRKNRIKLIKKYIDKVLVIFPFEKDFYKRHGVEAVYVGNPSFESIPDGLTGQNPSIEKKKIVFLPGSRTKEVTRHLPLMIGTKKLLQPLELSFAVIKYPRLPKRLFKKAGEEGIEIIEENRYHAIAESSIAVSSSGTATLELALLNIPTVVIYKTALLSWLILKSIVKIDFISIVNILAKEEVFPELIQYKASPANIAGYCREFLNNPEYYNSTKKKISRIKDVLSSKPASKTAAREILKEI